MMKRIACISLLMILGSPLLGFGQDAKEIDGNFENLSGQYAACAAYYRLVYHAMNSSNEKETANTYHKLEDTAMFYSGLLANEGRKRDVAVEVTNARIEMYLKKMKQEADNRNENISILINKYHYGCQEAMENPPSDVTRILQTKGEEITEQKERK